MSDFNLPSSLSVDSSKKNSLEKVDPTTMLKLHKAIEKLQADEVIQLTETYPFIERTLNTSLIKAIQYYKASSEAEEIISVLLNKGADPNCLINLVPSVGLTIKNDKTTAFMYAATKGLELVDSLLKFNNNVNIKDSLGRNAIMYAILADKGDNADIIYKLIEAGVNYNDTEVQEGNTPLIQATKKNLKDIVRCLLDCKADPDIQNNTGNTALHCAVINNANDIVETLLNHGANMDLMNREGKDCLKVALEFNRTAIYDKLASEKQLRDINSQRLFNEIEFDSNNQKLNKKMKNFRSQDQMQGGYNPNQEHREIREFKKVSNEREFKDNRSRTNTDHQYIGNNNSRQQYNVEYEKPNINPNTQFRPKQHSQPQYQTHSVPVPEGNYKFNNQTQNINININSMSIVDKTRNVSGTSGTSKICKLGKSKLSRKVFNIPEKPVSSAKINIPIEFINNMHHSNPSTHMYSYISMNQTPSLNIDISNKGYEAQLINSYYQNPNNSLLLEYENKLKQYEIEMDRFHSNNQELFEQLRDKDLEIQNYQEKDAQQKQKIIDLQSRCDDLEFKLQLEMNKSDKLERDIKELQSKNTDDSWLNCTSERNLISVQYDSNDVKRHIYLDRKFKVVKYDLKFICKCLQRDILDFQEYSIDLIKRQKPMQEELLKLIQDAVNESISDYEVLIYGSHATGLCLPWSDLDLVLVNKKGNNNMVYSYESTLRKIFGNLKDKPWKQSIKIIENTTIPIIKITTTDKYQNIQIDISIQDGKHYGLKCVELVLSFLQVYEALRPLIFSLKNILKNANLNDPYSGGLSSYGLILMVVSFLQNQMDHKKKISIADSNLGYLFVEFLFYYGWMFDHTKYVIYAYPPDESSHPDKELVNNLFLSSQLGQNELVIMDPLSKSNNVARSTYQFGNIKMAFMLGYVVSSEECECGCHYTGPNEESIYSSEHCILKRIFNSVKRFNGNNPIVGSL